MCFFFFPLKSLFLIVHSGYTPKNSPYDVSPTQSNDRWEPLLEDNGEGFFYFQEHVTPHIGEKAKFKFLPENDRQQRKAPPPKYSRSRFSEALDVIERMKQLDDIQKIQVEIFDVKTYVTSALGQAFIAKTLSDNYQDQELGKDGHILSWERFIHYAHGLGTAEYDATVIAWKEKVRYDLIRPTSVIKKLDGRDITTWTPNGVKTIPARDFEAYIRVMPHSEYISGSACIFEAQKVYVEHYLTTIGLDYDNFPVTFQTIPAGGSIAEPGVVPAQPLALSYPNVAAMARAGSDSRLDGGMHFPDAVTNAELICAEIGTYVAEGNFDLLG
jgi:hypothetical protein